MILGAPGVMVQRVPKWTSGVHNANARKKGVNPQHR